MSVPPRTLQVWFDFASADSHPLAMVVARRAADAQVAVQWRPFRVEPVERRRAERDELPPPDERGSDETSYWHAFVRQCDEAGVKGRRPSHHPRDSIPALRAALACEAEGLDAGAFIRAAFDANYVRDWNIGDATVLGEVLVEIDYDAARVLERARSLEVRAQLDANTAEALRQEFYGAPTLIASDGALHWGVDGLKRALAAAAAD